MIRMTTVMISIITASSALPMVPSAPHVKCIEEGADDNHDDDDEGDDCDDNHHEDDKDDNSQDNYRRSILCRHDNYPLHYQCCRSRDHDDHTDNGDKDDDCHNKYHHSFLCITNGA